MLKQSLFPKGFVIKTNTSVTRCPHFAILQDLWYHLYSKGEVDLNEFIY